MQILLKHKNNCGQIEIVNGAGILIDNSDV
jgi:hypothetical protein